MSDVPHWMPLYIADLQRDTAHLSTLEFGAYLKLLTAAWVGRGGLPTDEIRLCRLAGLTRKEWGKMRVVVLAFFQKEGDCYRHKRIDLEPAKAGALIEKKRAAGRASAEARARNKGNRCSTGVGPGVGTELQQSGNQSQSQGSVSKETAADASQDLVKKLFDDGVILLTADGSKPGVARAFIGKLRKENGDKEVSAALAEAVRLNVSEPKAWLTARLKRAAHDSSELWRTIDRTFGAVGVPHAVDPPMLDEENR